VRLYPKVVPKISQGHNCVFEIFTAAINFLGNHAVGKHEMQAEEYSLVRM